MNSNGFSVIVPTFNRLEYLQQALDTVWSQRFSDYEVIVVDDGSSDGTWAYLEGLRGRVRAVRQDNKGPGAARNAGAKIAAGRYLAFLDSDDCWFPWTLEMHARVIAEMNNPAWVSGAHRDFARTDAAVTLDESALRFVRYEDYLATSRSNLWLGVPGTVIRRDVFLREPFDESDTNGEDNDLWLRLGTEQGFGYIREPPAFGYRRHSESRVSQFGFSMRGAQIMIDNERSRCYPGGTARARERRRIIGRHLRPITVNCARSGRYQVAMSLYRQMLAWNLADLRVRFLIGVPVLMLLSLMRRNAG